MYQGEGNCFSTETTVIIKGGFTLDNTNDGNLQTLVTDVSNKNNNY